MVVQNAKAQLLIAARLVRCRPKAATSCSTSIPASLRSIANQWRENHLVCSAHCNPLIRRRFFGRARELLGTSSGVDGEEVESLLLEFGRARVYDELVSGIECGGDGVSRQGGEIGEKGLKAVH